MNERIKLVRQRNGLTQEAFASRLGITKSSVSLIESGKNNPSEQTIRGICSEFGIRREWLLLGDEPMKASEMTNAPETLVPDLVAVLSEYPAVLDMFQRVIGRMTSADWQRLNALLDEVLEAKKDPQA